jgi:hypothetical protein
LFIAYKRTKKESLVNGEKRTKAEDKNKNLPLAMGL